MRILLVEDDDNLAKLLATILSKHNYLVDVSSDGEIAWEMIHVIDYDLVLLDVNLPRLDGMALCRRLRDHNHQVAVLLMTVRDSVTDKLLGLESGADDYLIKPLDLQELLARIRVLSRRVGEQTTAPLVCGAMQLNPERREVSYQGQVLPFSRKEYLLIELFLRHPQRVFSRSDIVDQLWSLDNLPTDDTVKSHIRRIRRKLSQVGAENLIETLYGHGYRINQAFLKQSQANSVDSQQQDTELTEAIEQVWQNIRLSVLEQVISLEQAAALLGEGVLEAERLRLAQRTAHNLTGTVGSCGFETASHIARAIETLLHRQPLQISMAGSVSQLVKALRFQLEQSPTIELDHISSKAPEAEQSPEPLSKLSELSELPDAQAIRVLAIDDDPGILALLEQILTAEGMQVTALPVLLWNTLEVVQPDLLILDVNMPTINGLELCQSIRATPKWRWLPILILTVQTDRQLVQQVFGCGADDYVTKPIVPEELVTRILNRIRRSQQLRSKL